MKKSPVTVSDHAVLRYLQRARGLDVEAVRREIGRAVDLATEHPGASGIIVDGMLFRLSLGRVVTVTFACLPDRRTGRIRRERPE